MGYETLGLISIYIQWALWIAIAVITLKTIIPSMVKDLLQNGQTGWIKGFQGKKGAYTAKILFKNGKIEFEFPEQRHR